ncbi:hypothetical protein LRS05_16460 [Flavobacterium sp. J372]|uniref:hypothetical protein n=1 Tax=Flavobacterium sp. J372 TaxID=2898436 RepID=UPI0021513A99|nr:hypothetical protein [Flavobacterium sp. J372]MCR5863596.1 hypothetical protein [Flavobacterium sp. J372]
MRDHSCSGNNPYATVSRDGIPTQEIDPPSYYTLNGQRYQFVTDKTGYRVISGDNQNFGTMRRTSNNNYIYRSGTTTSIGYFDKARKLCS